MYKNESGQIIQFYVQSEIGDALSGDAANITPYLSKGGGAFEILTNPTVSEIGYGWYYVALSQSETNYNNLVFRGESSTQGAFVYSQAIELSTRFLSEIVDGSVDIERLFKVLLAVYAGGGGTNEQGQLYWNDANGDPLIIIEKDGNQINIIQGP